MPKITIKDITPKNPISIAGEMIGPCYGSDTSNPEKNYKRGLNAIKDSADADTVKEGMELIYNKLVKFLEQKGVKAMDTKDATFDVEFHEAVALIPATDESMKGKILDTVEKGYMYNDKVLRHAKVVVCQ